MDLYERYTQGHYGDMTGVSLACPLWAKELGWDGLGCWVIVQQSDLLAAIPGLTIYSITNRPVIMIISHPPKDALSVYKFFEDLEDRNLNVIAHAQKLQLVCLGATLVRGQKGLTELVGVFELQAEMTPGSPVLHFRLPSRLILCNGMGTAELPTGMTVVPYFTVKAQVTMNSALIADLADDEFEEAHMPVRRKSLMGPVFLSSKSKGADIGIAGKPKSQSTHKTSLSKIFRKTSQS